MTRVCDTTVTLQANADEFLGALSTAQAQVDRANRYREIAGATRLLEYIQCGTRTEGYIVRISEPSPSDIELARKFLRRRITALQNLLTYWPSENRDSHQRWKDSLGIKDVTTI